jgi:GNAT superfamily N-acetyltransferase
MSTPSIASAHDPSVRPSHATGPPRPITVIAPTCPLPPGITIRTSANLPRVVAELTRMINAAYEAGEQGLWPPNTPRVFEHEVQAMVDNEELLFVRRGGEIAGLVRVHALDQRSAELGLLTAAKLDSGVGGELIRLAEEWARERGLPRMRLTLLIPHEGTHPFKQRLHSWYSRLGYRAIGAEDVAKALPEIEKTVIPCDLVTYEKVLAAPQP